MLVKSQEPLKGKTIVLDPGHGGSDQELQVEQTKSLEKIIHLKAP